jgi:hypothetical protein
MPHPLLQMLFMTTTALRISAAIVATASSVLASVGFAADASPQPPRIKRSEAFFGIHFDLHHTDKTTGYGAKTTPEMIERFLAEVRPDYVQIDSKGHPGLSSYPTRVGFAAPGIVGDPLKVWRDVTARMGVALVVHHSGVADDKANAMHPEWAAITADGTPHKRATSLFGPYADKLLIPQLKEIASYGVDGVWVDGDCWGVVRDYSPAAAAAFKAATGFEVLPKSPTEPHWAEFLEFNRAAYRRYLKHYVSEVKAAYPEFQICSNWAFSDHMPEPVSVPVDFLSGDATPQDAVNSIRLAARYLVHQGLPWELMAWGHSNKPDRRQKPAVQMQREAALALACGGAFEPYFKQKPDGSIHEDQVPVMAAIARFCRERQSFCHRAQPVPQVAVLYSTVAHYRSLPGPFPRKGDHVLGVLMALIESQESVELLGEHSLSGRMADYPLIVVPEWDYLEPRFATLLLDYVREGGNLLLVGPRSAALFQEQLGVTAAGPVAEATRTLAFAGAITQIPGRSLTVKAGLGVTALGELREKAEATAATSPAATVRPLGKGRIAATWFEMGTTYREGPDAGMRTFMHALVRSLFPEPMVTIEGSSDVDVIVARNHGDLLVHLVNTSGPHQTQSIIDHIEPLGPMTVTVRSAQAPSKVALQPSGRSPKFTFGDGRVRIEVPSVEIHEAIIITP